MRQADLHEQPYEVLRDQVREYYDNFLGYLENDLKRSNPRHARVLAALEKLTKPGMRVLDLGCGIGITTRALRKMNGGAETVGVDLSPALIGKAETLSDAEFLVADVTELALGRPFDLLCMVDALEHIAPSRYEALWDVFAAHAAPGATLYLNLPNPKLLETLQEETPEALQILDESVPLEEMIRLAYARGFQLLAFQSYGISRPEEYVEVVLRAPGQIASAAPKAETEQPHVPAVVASRRDGPLKLGVWASDGNNTHFLDPILARLPARYEVVRMGEGGSATEIRLGLQDVDVAWFEWAMGPAVVGSQHAAGVPTVVRLHRFEAYTEWPRSIEWANVDDLIFVSDGVRRSFDEMHEGLLAKASTRVHVVHNGIDTALYPFDPDRKRGFDLAFVGRLHYVKNPMLLVQLMAALVKREPRYTLHIAGDAQQLEVYRYLRYQAEQLGLSDHIKIYGRLGADELRTLLQQCSYVISTSVIEGHPVGVMEGMAMGLKPVVHDFFGARDLFESGFLWNTVEEAVRLITRGSFEPQAYRQFIEERYSFEQQVEHVTRVLDRAAAQYHPERVAALLEAPPEVFGEAVLSRVAQAQQHADAGRYREALSALAGVEYAALPEAQHVEARVLALQLALACDASTEALRHADVLTDLAPEEPLVLNLAGRALWEAGQHQAALDPLIAAAERIEAESRLPFEADQIRQDAFDALTALGRTRLAARFAPPVAA